MRRRRVLAVVGSATVAALAGCAAVGANADGSDYDVGTTAVAFEPDRITVGVGDEVVWQNTSSRSHTVTAYESGIPDGARYFASGGYDSERAARTAWRRNLGGKIETGERFSHTFEAAGTYRYFCIPHEQAGMVGSVEVTSDG